MLGCLRSLARTSFLGCATDLSVHASNFSHKFLLAPTRELIDVRQVIEEKWHRVGIPLMETTGKQDQIGL
jgi:hypothetical protein